MAIDIGGIQVPDGNDDASKLIEQLERIVRDLMPRAPKRLVGAPMYGASWDGVSPLITQDFVWSGATIASGHFSVPFLEPFPNALLSATISNSNMAFGGVVGVEYPSSGTNTNQLYGKATFGTGSPGAISIRVAVHAVGW